MARVKKDLVTEGEFWVTDPDTGLRRKEVLTRARFAKWLDSYNKLRSKGYNVPAPFDHVAANGELPEPVRFGRHGASKALENSGFLESLTQEIRDAGDGKSIAVLVGEIEVPGDENDPNSNAYKVGRTVKDTSVYVRPGYLDGTGEIHEEGFMHVAMVVNPIQPGLANFQTVKGDRGLAIAMSQMVMSNSTPGGLAAQFDNDDDNETGHEPDDTLGDPSGQISGDLTRRVVEALRQAKIMDLPDDTDETMILKYILVATRQKQLMPGPSGGFVPPGQQPPVPPAGAAPGAVPPGQPGATSAPPVPGQVPGQAAADPSQPPAPGQSEQPPVPGQPPVNLKKPPKAGVEQPPSIAMSHTPEQERALLMSQVGNLEASNKLLASYVTNLEAEKRAIRIANLVSSGRVTQAYADAHLKPALQGFTMSLDSEGKLKPNSIDMTLGALEAQPARTGSVINTLSSIDLGSIPVESQAAVASILMSMGGVNLPPGASEQGLPGGANFFNRPGGQQTEEEAIATADAFLANVAGN